MKSTRTNKQVFGILSDEIKHSFKKCGKVKSTQTLARHVGKKGCPGYDTKLHLVVTLQFWNSEEYGVHFNHHYSQLHSDPEW